MTELKSEFLIIVPCGKKKIWDIDQYYKGKKVAARFAYKGGLSSSAIACAQTFEHLGNPFKILSTKYGFLDPNEKIEMYREEKFVISDQTLIEQAKSQELSEIRGILVLALIEYYQKVRMAFQHSDIQIGHLLKFCTSRGEQMHYIKGLKERGQKILQYHKEERNYLIENFKQVFLSNLE